MINIERHSNWFTNPLNTPRINTISITFNHLIQCGVDKFLRQHVYSNDGDPFIPNDKKAIDYIQEKSMLIPEDKLHTAYKSINDIFSYYLPEEYFIYEKYPEVKRIKSLLQEILIASNAGTSLFIHVDRIAKDLLKAKEILPLELFLPIRFLLNSITQDTVNLPRARYSLNKEDIKRFKKVFEEQAYMDYKMAHTMLDNDKELKKQCSIKDSKKQY